MPRPLRTLIAGLKGLPRSVRRVPAIDEAAALGGIAAVVAVIALADARDGSMSVRTAYVQFVAAGLAVVACLKVWPRPRPSDDDLSDAADACAKAIIEESFPDSNTRGLRNAVGQRIYAAIKQHAARCEAE